MRLGLRNTAVGGPLGGQQLPVTTTMVEHNDVHEATSVSECRTLSFGEAMLTVRQAQDRTRITSELQNELGRNSSQAENNQSFASATCFSLDNDTNKPETPSLTFIGERELVEYPLHGVAIDPNFFFFFFGRLVIFLAICTFSDNKHKQSLLRCLVWM